MRQLLAWLCAAFALGSTCTAVGAGGRLEGRLANPFYAMDTAFRRHGLTEAQQFALVKELGFDGISWHAEEPQKVKARLAALRKLGLKMFAIYCASRVTPEGKLVFDPRLPELMAALKGEGTIVWLHIGGKGPETGSLTGSEPVVGALRELAQKASSHGLRIAIYPHYGEWTGRFRDALRLAQLVNHPKFGVTFNLCHALACGEEREIPALLRRAGNLLFTVTISGADRGVAGPKWNRLIQTLDRGTFPVLKLLRLLARLGFKGPIGFQGYGIKGDARSILTSTIQAWRRMCRAVVGRRQARRVSPIPPNVKVYRDLVYARPGRRPLRLDLYIPEGVKNPPLIVWIHGGAWRAGTKRIDRVASLLRHGYAIAGIEYRLSQEAKFPAQIADCKGAVRWLRAHAAEYGYDANRIGAAGSSAGGHLAALLGTSAGVEELRGDVSVCLDYSDRVQAVCDMWGPTDFLRMGGRHDAPDSPESQLIGGPIRDHPQKVARANPITYVDPKDPPFLLIHGENDRMVPPGQSELLAEALKHANVPCELKILPGAGHGARGYPPQKLAEMIRTFFDRTLRR